MKRDNIVQNKIVKIIIATINRIFEILKIDGYISIISLKSNKKPIPIDLEKEFLEIYDKCKNYTMTTIECMFSLYKAVEYLSKNKISGDIVECGVWKGGSMMLVALTLLKMKDVNRKIYLYDTYEGMSEPTNHDIRARDNSRAIDIYNSLMREKKKWAYSSIDEVKNNLFSTNYPKENLNFIKGMVEDTIPLIIPEKISLLRLDTDWYESTYHELLYLHPMLVHNGILILDDYGHWIGAKKAVDNYFKEKQKFLLLNRIDNKGRIAINI